MGLAEFTVSNLRCWELARLDLHPGHNLIWGDNASGKTSLLEGVFILGRGRSFRTRSSERLIRHSQSQLTVFGRTDDGIARPIGVQVSAQGTVGKVGGHFVQSLAELSSAFAVQVIEPGIHRLLEEGGHRRRRWMDWGVFHVEPSFISHWAAYTRALKQRNAALRAQPAQASLWEPELARLGELVGASRALFLEKLHSHWVAVASQLLGTEIELHYAQGWAQASSLAEALAQSRERDLRRGVTHVGPHRGDILIRARGKLARDVLSRGQQKLAAIAMTLAPLFLIRELQGHSPSLLLDDPAAELDQRRLEIFAAKIAELRCQRIVTALSTNLDPLGPPDRVFHVEHGRVEPV
jgi:DNA replication and repair protein RecF